MIHLQPRCWFRFCGISFKLSGNDATILYSGQNDGNGLTLPASPPLAQAYWNKKAYTTPSIRQNYGTNKNFWINIKIIRYADVILMAAEAANELGNSATASEYLEMIRSRARGTNTSVLPKVTATDKATLRTAIKQERRIEFAMEGERFYDLVRWGDAKETYAKPLHHYDGSVIYPARNFNPAIHHVWPIPPDEIAVSKGALTQNQGW